MNTDFKIKIECTCKGRLWQIAKFEKRYNRRTFKCLDCNKTTTLNTEGIKERIKITNN